MNPSRRKPILAALLVAAWALTVAVPARSADGDAPSTTPASPQAPPAARSGPPDPPVVERLRASGLDMQPGGIIGRDFRFWLIAAKDGRRAFAATTSEGYLVLGKIYSPDGSLNLDTEGQTPLFLDAEDRRAHGLARLTGATPTPATDFAWRTPGRRAAAGPPGTVWDLLGHATAIEEGRVGALSVYIFVDPYCSYCHRQWEVLRKKVQAGLLRVRWALVAALDRSQADLGVVGGLLADPRPETLAVWMREQRVRRSESEAAKKALGANMALFQALKAPSVPAILYKDKTGKLVTRVGVTDL